MTQLERYVLWLIHRKGLSLDAAIARAESDTGQRVTPGRIAYLMRKARDLHTPRIISIWLHTGGHYSEIQDQLAEETGERIPKARIAYAITKHLRGAA